MISLFAKVKTILLSGVPVLMLSLLSASAALLIVFGVLIFVIFDCLPLPSDEVLVSQFNSKKVCLEQLLKMSDEDEEFTTIARATTAPTYAGELPSNRRKLYCELFDQGELQYGIKRSDSGDVFFVVQTSCVGDCKGFARLQKRPHIMLHDLDKHSVFGFWCDHQQVAGDGAFRDLGNGWYIWRGLQF